MYACWLDGVDPEDASQWDANTFEEAAEMHVDGRIIPDWDDLGRPRTVLIHVAEDDKVSENYGDCKSFRFDIDLIPSRGYRSCLGDEE